MSEEQEASVVDIYRYRRRASDRARERAGRAAYFGDRAGLLIATSAVVALMNARVESQRVGGRRESDPA
jgi:hypothetical protein